MKSTLYYLVLLISLLSLSNCSKDVGPIDNGLADENISFSNDIQPIFDQNCVSCHPSSGNLDLTATNSYNNLVNVNASGYSAKRVVPNNSDQSVLYKKIDGSEDYGSNMPLGSNLSQTQINAIKQWIDEGALNN